MHIETVCNTPDDVLFAQIKENSARKIPWLKSEEAHDRQAVIVGGGPSSIEWLHEIRYRQENGQTIFALNNAARFLAENGITPDHQVIVDARESNKEFVGYAKHHYLSSQCHPSLFDAATSVTLWHQEYPEDMECFDSCLPQDAPAHTLIGGGTTVGLSAMVLAYALGYRKLHLYGYDSSYRDDRTHAYFQDDPQNVECFSTVAGKSFRTSLAMAKQAELFPQLSDSLIDLGCLITLRGDGLLPWTSQMSAIQPEKMDEREKYTRMWEFPNYRHVAPGEDVAEKFIQIAEINSEDVVIDFGCGTGRGAKKVHDLTGCEFILVDFTTNSLDKKVANDIGWYTRLIHDLTKDLPVTSEKGFCTDVMEHIPPDDVNAVLNNIMRASRRVFFQISLVDDVCGALIGQPLHLCVQPIEWWAKKFSDLGYTVNWSEDCGNSALFYVINPLNP
jgi:SAM-dependent methyltransferase